MRRYIWITLICTILQQGQFVAQDLSIPEAVERARPGPLVTARISELTVPSFETAIREAHTILVGRLSKPTPYLSADQRNLYTDYELIPIQVIVASQRRGSSRPGPQRLVVRVWGGDTIINGVKVKIYDANFDPLPVDRPLLLFLAWSDEIGKYEIYPQGSYAFEVVDGERLRPRVKSEEVLEPVLRDGRLSHVVHEIGQQRTGSGK